MNVTKLKIDVSVELNSFGKNEIRIRDNKDTSFQLRIGYWERLDYSIIKKLQDKFHIYIKEELYEDEDCGMLYGYDVYYELPDDEEDPLSNCCGAPFTFPGWPDSDMCSQCYEHADYEKEELEWIVDNKIDIG